MDSYENKVEVRVEEINVIPKLDRKVKRRRRSIKAGSNEIRRLGELINTKPVIGNRDILAAAPNIFRIGNNTFGNIEIPNGWETTRGVFNAIITEESDSIVKTVYLTGYTDSYDTSYNGLFDDRVVFFINKIYVTSSTKTRNGLTRPRIVDVFTVSDGTIEVSEDLYLLRTEDVLLDQTADEVFGGREFSNETNLITSAPVSRSVNEMVGSRVVQKMLDNSNRSRLRSESLGMREDDAELLTNAHNMSISVSLHTVEFISMLSERTEYNLVTSFTLEEIFRMFGNDVDVAAEKSVRSLVEADANRDTGDINGDDEYARCANEVFYNIGAIAATYLLSDIVFKIDNLGRRVEFKILEADTIMSGVDAFGLATLALEEFISEVWPILTENNSRDLELIASYSSDSSGAKVDVSYDGKAFVPFFLPTYLDGLLSPDIHTRDSYETEMRSFKNLNKLIMA